MLCEPTEAPSALEAQRRRYEAAGQAGVLRFADKLPPAELDALVAQLADIEVDQVKGYLASAKANEAAAGGEMAPAVEGAGAGLRISRSGDRDPALLTEEGLAVVARGEAAVCVLGGGQGTRLGFAGPKGCYDIGFSSSSRAGSGASLAKPGARRCLSS